ncbi:hypothetical protein ScPMuIL_010753 [Solemya velum]
MAACMMTFLQTRSLIFPLRNVSQMTLALQSFRTCFQQRCKVRLFSVGKSTVSRPRTNFRSTYGGLFSIGMIGLSAGFFSFGKKKEEDDPVLHLIKSAVLAQSQQLFPEAERLYHEALQTAEIRLKKKQMSDQDYLFAKTHIFDRMADLALSQGQLENSEKLFKETMKGCLQTGSTKTDNDIIEISVKLASIYALLKRDSEAEQGFEFCIETQKSKVSKDSEPDNDTLGLLGLALESYGRYLLLHRKYDQAQPMLEEAVEIAKKLWGEEHNQVLILLNDLATVQIFKKNYTSAEKTLKEAIVIGDKMQSKELPALYSNLGAVYLRQNLMDNARQACQTAKVKATHDKNKFSVSQADQCLQKIQSVLNKKN